MSLSSNNMRRSVKWTDQPASPEGTVAVDNLLDSNARISDWEELYSKKYDRIYWRNKSTGDTSWKHPDSIHSKKNDNNIDSSSSTSEIKSPGGDATDTVVTNNNTQLQRDPLWEECFSDKYNRRYWRHKISKKTTWKESNTMIPVPLLEEPSEPPEEAEAAPKLETDREETKDTAIAIVIAEPSLDIAEKGGDAEDIGVGLEHVSITTSPSTTTDADANIHNSDSQTIETEDAAVLTENASTELTIPTTTSNQHEDAWVENFSKKHTRKYWRNSITGEVAWSNPVEKPKVDIPAVPVSPSIRASIRASLRSPSIESNDSILASSTVDNSSSGTADTNAEERYWVESFSEKHQRVYWINNKTNQRTWRRPSIYTKAFDNEPPSTPSMQEGSDSSAVDVDQTQSLPVKVTASKPDLDDALEPVELIDSTQEISAENNEVTLSEGTDTSQSPVPKETAGTTVLVDDNNEEWTEGFNEQLGTHYWINHRTMEVQLQPPQPHSKASQPSIPSVAALVFQKASPLEPVPLNRWSPMDSASGAIELPDDEASSYATSAEAPAASTTIISSRLDKEADAILQAKALLQSGNNNNINNNSPVGIPGRIHLTDNDFLSEEDWYVSRPSRSYSNSSLGSINSSSRNPLLSHQPIHHHNPHPTTANTVAAVLRVEGPNYHEVQPTQVIHSSQVPSNAIVWLRDKTDKAWTCCEIQLHGHGHNFRITLTSMKNPKLDAPFKAIGITTGHSLTAGIDHSTQRVHSHTSTTTTTATATTTTSYARNNFQFAKEQMVIKFSNCHEIICNENPCELLILEFTKAALRNQPAGTGSRFQFPSPHRSILKRSPGKDNSSPSAAAAGGGVFAAVDLSKFNCYRIRFLSITAAQMFLWALRLRFYNGVDPSSSSTTTTTSDPTTSATLLSVAGMATETPIPSKQSTTVLKTPDRRPAVNIHNETKQLLFLDPLNAVTLMDKTHRWMEALSPFDHPIIKELITDDLRLVKSIDGSYGSTQGMAHMTALFKDHILSLYALLLCHPHLQLFVYTEINNINSLVSAMVNKDSLLITPSTLQDSPPPVPIIASSSSSSSSSAAATSMAMKSEAAAKLANASALRVASESTHSSTLLSPNRQQSINPSSVINEEISKSPVTAAGGQRLAIMKVLELTNDELYLEPHE